MKKQNKELLVSLKIESLKDKYPSMPKHAIPIPKYTDTTANGLTKCIIDFINLSGGQAERISTTGRFIVDKQKLIGSTSIFGKTKSTSGKWIKGNGTNGSADISSTIKGMSVKIEVKIGKDRQSEDQKEYQKSIERAGGIYFIANNFDNFITFYEKICTTKSI